MATPRGEDLFGAALEEQLDGGRANVSRLDERRLPEPSGEAVGHCSGHTADHRRAVGR